MIDDSSLDARSALAAAWQLQRTGNFVAAFDLAQDALQRWPDSQPLQHISILALASCGSTQAALAAFRATALATTENEDFLALEARLLKDAAFRGRPSDMEALLIQAAEAYERIAQRTGGSYTAQNAALLWALAGNEERAIQLANSVVEHLARSGVPSDEQAAYFHWATMAEAALVLGDQNRLEDAVARANPLCRRNLWARTRTLTQMQRLGRLRPACAAIVEGWYRPPIGLVLTREQMLSSPVSTPMAGGPDIPALAYSIASDRESDWQSLAAQGVQLHVILAAALPEESATGSGYDTTRRHASGHRGAYTWSSLLLDVDDDNQQVCAKTALGLSLGHADALHAPWVVLSRSGDRWHQYRDVDRVSLGASLSTYGSNHSRYGFLFADAVGYSNLNAADTRGYWAKLLPDSAAAVLRRHSDTLLFRKTWGDAIHCIFRTAAAAAQAALEMQAATARLAEELQLGRRLAFRVAVHFGTADSGVDPVEDASTFFGPQLSFAARIVPVAPPGGVFVTEPFAAQLSLEGATSIECTYVGTTSLPKGYGRVRLLTLASRS